MIEETLFNYGVLGLWTLSLLYKEVKFNKEMKKILLDLTELIKKKIK